MGVQAYALLYVILKHGCKHRFGWTSAELRLLLTYNLNHTHCPPNLVVDVSEVSYTFNRAEDITVLFNGSEFQTVKMLILNLSLRGHDHHNLDMEATLVSSSVHAHVGDLQMAGSITSFQLLVRH